jgi:plasmid maintenance system antidote protein VapI
MREGVTRALLEYMSVQGITIGVLARRIHMSPVAITDLLRADGPWELDAVYRMAEAMDVSVWSLLNSALDFRPQLLGRPVQ